jgi:hypothetical protein
MTAPAPTLLAAADAAPPQARVVVMMMQKNETLLLDPWLRYHAALFGADALLVADNGSTDPATRARLDQAEAEGVRVIRDYPDKAHFEKREAIFLDLAGALDPDRCDFVMPLDCDEFVAHQALDGEIACTGEAVRGYLARRHLRDPRLLLTRGSYFNIPGRPGEYFFQAERKCFFATGMLGFLGKGFHSGRPRHSDREVRTELIHFHYRHKPLARLKADAWEKLGSRLPSRDPAAIRAFRGAGAHLKSFLHMDEDDYRAHFVQHAAVPLTPLRATLHRLGAAMPY